MQYKDPDKKIGGRLCKIFKKKREKKKKENSNRDQSAFVLFMV